MTGNRGLVRRGLMRNRGIATVAAVLCVGIITTPSAQAEGASGGQVLREFAVGAGIDLNEGAGDIVDIAALPDGKVLVGGSFSSVQGEFLADLAKFGPDGRVDRSFRLSYDTRPPEFPPNFEVRQTGVAAIEVLSPNRIMVGGVFADGSTLKIVNARGTVVESFEFQEPESGQRRVLYDNYGFNGQVRSIEAIDSSTFMIGGDFTSYSGRKVARVGRFKLVDNVLVLDQTFVSQFSRSSRDAFAVSSTAVLSGGTILVGGSFSKYGSRKTNGLVHVGRNGGFLDSFDFSFRDKPGTIMAIQPGYANGSIAVGGIFDTAYGTPASGLMMLSRGLTNAGRRGITPEFNFLRSGFALERRSCDDRTPKPFVQDLELDEAGYLYVSGNFDRASLGGQEFSRSNIVRLEPNFGIDPNWAPGGFFDTRETGYFEAAECNEQVNGSVVREMGLGADGSLTVGGFFGSVVDFQDRGARPEAIRSGNLARLATPSRPSTGSSAGDSGVTALAPVLVLEESKEPVAYEKASVVFEAAVMGSLNAAEELSQRLIVVGVTDRENGQCREVQNINVTNQGLERVVVDTEVRSGAGSYICAKQQIRTTAGDSVSDTTHVPVVSP